MKCSDTRRDVQLPPPFVLFFFLKMVTCFVWVLHLHIPSPATPLCLWWACLSMKKDHFFLLCCVFFSLFLFLFWSDILTGKSSSFAFQNRASVSNLPNKQYHKYYTYNKSSTVVFRVSDIRDIEIILVDNANCSWWLPQCASYSTQRALTSTHPDLWFCWTLRFCHQSDIKTGILIHFILQSSFKEYDWELSSCIFNQFNFFKVSSCTPVICTISLFLFFEY